MLILPSGFIISKNELIKVPWIQKPVHVIPGYLCLKTTVKEPDGDTRGEKRRQTVPNALKNENELINVNFLG